MASESQFLRALLPSLPTEIASKLRSICAASPTHESALENLVRFLLGGDAAPDASTGVGNQWVEKQAAVRAVVHSLVPLQSGYDDDRKRSRDAEDDIDVQSSKKPRLATATTTPPDQTQTQNQTDTPPPPLDPGPPLFTLHALSTTSPIRKKVDITVHRHAVVLTHPSTKSVEATIPTGSLRRAFILPTRGKTKAHWSVVVLSGDVPDGKAKGKSAAGAGVTSENQQIIFGIDAAPSSNFTTTTYEGPSSSSQPNTDSQSKGTPTLPFIRQLLTYLSLPTPIIEPAEQGPSTFKSACPGILGGASSSTGTGTSTPPIPGVEAYRGAKGGNLWFAKEGVLWGESKPCEFWAVEDLMGVRVLGAGRTCSVVLTRRVKVEVTEGESGEGEDGKEEEEEEEEEMGEETEFGMVDAKERAGIQEWVQRHHHRFYTHSSLPSQKNQKGKGKEILANDASNPKLKTATQNVNTGPMTIHTLQDLSDAEDDDFDVDVSDLDGSERSSEEDSSSSDDDEGDGEGEGEGSGSGSGDDAGELDAEDQEEEGEDDEDQDEDELDPAHHPLLRPGAVPRMSKAAIQMAVGIVEGAFSGGGGGADRDDIGEGEEEEDELDE